MLILKRAAAVTVIGVVFCMAPGIAVLASTTHGSMPSCCEPSSHCGTGLQATSCCVTDSTPQALAPAGPATLASKRLEQERVDALFETTATDQVGSGPSFAAARFPHPDAARDPARPLYLLNSTFLI